MDEPSSAIGDEEINVLFKQIFSLREQGVDLAAGRGGDEYRLYALDGLQHPAPVGHVPQPAEKIRRLPRRERDHSAHRVTPFLVTAYQMAEKMSINFRLRGKKMKNFAQLQVARDKYGGRGCFFAAGVVG